MICPTCAKSNVRCTDSRETPHGRRRRYYCLCGERFTTLENVSHTGDIRGHKSQLRPDEILKWRGECIARIEAAVNSAMSDIKKVYGVQP